MKFFQRKTDSALENEVFITLMQVAKEDTAVKKQLLAILRLDDFNRKSLLNTFLASMRTRGAPPELVKALGHLLEDQIAYKALDFLSAEPPSPM